MAWDEESQSYTDGTNRVTVRGVASVNLIFGAGATPSEADLFDALSDAGAFDAFTTRKIFEDSGIGILA